MGRRASVLLLAALLTSACAEPTLYTLARDGAASAVIVTLAPQRGPATARAHDLRTPVTIEVEPETSERVVVLRYDAPLAELGLPEGELHPVEQGSGLPSADHVDVLDLSADPIAWSSLEQPPPEVEGLRFSDGLGCKTFAAVLMPAEALELVESVTAMTAAGPDRAVFVTDFRRAFQIDLAGQISPVSPATVGLVRSAFTALDGDVWLLGQHGKMLRGTPERGFGDDVSIPARTEVWVDLDGPHEEAPFELFALSSSLAVQHFDGSSWRLIRGPRPMRDDRARARLAWLEPGRVVVIGSGAAEAVEVGVDGSERVAMLSLPERVGTSDAVFGAEYVRDLGVVVGTRYLVLFLREPGLASWRRLAVPLEVPKAEAIVDLGDRRFMAGGRGAVSEWSEAFGLCPATRLHLDEDFNGHAVLGKTVVLSSGGSPGPIFSFLTPNR